MKFSITLFLTVIIFITLLSRPLLGKYETPKNPKYPEGCMQENNNSPETFFFICRDFSYESRRAEQYGYDIYLPNDFALNSINRFPLIIAIHGGSWGSSRNADPDFIQFIKNLTTLGFVVANIDYYSVHTPSLILDPTQAWTSERNPTIDLAEFTDRIIFNDTHANYFRIDLNKVFLVGFSAGGHLALMESTRSKQSYFGVFVGSAPTDIDLMSDYYDDPNVCHTLINVFGQSMAFRTEMSPRTHVKNLKTQILFMEHSDTDNLVPIDHAENFFKAARCAGLEKISNFVPGLEVETENGYIKRRHYFPNDQSRLEKSLEEILIHRIDYEYNSDQLRTATSNSEIWPAVAAIDGDADTIYSSSELNQYNTEKVSLEARTESILPTRINAVSLRSRLWALGSLGFPKFYDIFVLNQNQQWELAGKFDFQPDAFGLVEIKLNTTYYAFGIKIVPTELGTDNYGKYYFQLADLDIRFREFN